MESNHIEGIHRDPTFTEVEATEQFLLLRAPCVEALQRLALVYQPNAHLRDQPGMNVQVGGYLPPRGGREIARQLRVLLNKITDATPFEFHTAYEALHPFMDGNGRTGRALWAWQMLRLEGSRGLNLGFLHKFYYQTLGAR